MWWRTNPMIPLFRASSEDFELWELTSTPIGITEKCDNRLFAIYPNPANNIFNITSLEQISMVEVYNITGQLQLSSKESHLDISRLKTGVYFVRAYSEKGVVSEKFVKE